MQFLRARRKSLGLDMAPLIDIVFLLLIFFMLSSSFLQPSLQLNLPKAVSHEDSKRPYVMVSIDESENLFVNKRPSSMETLQNDLERELENAEQKSVHLRGDKTIPYGTFVKAMDRSRRAGATQVNIIHQPES